MPAPPTISINGISCTFAMPGGRLTIAESAGADGPQTTLVLQCDWEDRWDLVAALRGTCVGNAYSFVRTPPYALPNNPNLVCTSVGEFQYIGSGVDGDDGSVFSQLARVPAQFSPVPWQFQDGDPNGQNDPSGQAWTVTRIKPSAEVYQPMGGTYYIAPFPSTTPLDEASVGLLRANAEIQVTRKFLPAMPLGAIASLIGSVNFFPVQFGDQTYKLGKLLLIAVESSDPYFDCLGNPVIDITYTYLGRAFSWNTVQDRSGVWNSLNTKADGSGTEPFDTNDFSTLPR